jgi:hypothetical protein
LVAEDAEGEQHHVDRAVGEHLAEDALVGLGSERVEGDGVHVRAERPQAPGRVLQREGGAPRQPHGTGAAGDQTARGGQRDLGRAAEDEQGPGQFGGILHDR